MPAAQQSDPVIPIPIYTLLFSDYLPPQSTPRDWIEFPVLYHRTSLLSHSKCHSLHLLTPSSPSIPLPPPTPLATTSLFSGSEIYFCFLSKRYMQLYVHCSTIHNCLIFLIDKCRIKKVNKFIYGHMTGEWQTQGLNAGVCLQSGSVILCFLLRVT